MDTQRGTHIDVLSMNDTKVEQPRSKSQNVCIEEQPEEAFISVFCKPKFLPGCCHHDIPAPTSKPIHS